MNDAEKVGLLIKQKSIMQKNYFMKKEVHTPCTPDYRLLRSRKNVWGGTDFD